MTGAGTSAEMEYRSLRWRRRRWRLAAASTGLASAAVGSWLLLTRGALRPGAVMWLAAVGAWALLRWPGFGGRDVARWERGAEGERRTAFLLSSLSHRRWVVRHDLALPGSRVNIDHLVVGRTGLWVLDTKFTGLEVRARWGRVHFGDRPLQTGAVRWEAEMVAERLARHLGDGAVRLDRVVRPLVAVHCNRPAAVDRGPGRRASGLKRRGARAGGVAVVAAEDVVHRLRRGRRRLTRSQIRLLVSVVDQAFPSYRGSSLA